MKQDAQENELKALIRKRRALSLQAQCWGASLLGALCLWIEIGGSAAAWTAGCGALGWLWWRALKQTRQTDETLRSLAQGLKEAMMASSESAPERAERESVEEPSELAGIELKEPAGVYMGRPVHAIAVKNGIEHRYQGLAGDLPPEEGALVINGLLYQREPIAERSSEAKG